MLIWTKSTTTKDKRELYQWRAREIKNADGSSKIEIRRTFTKTNNKDYPHNKNIFAQCLIIISDNNINTLKDCNVIFSMNGKCGLSFEELDEMQIVIKEAKDYLLNGRCN